MGADLEGEPSLAQADDGALSFDIGASLPDAGLPQPAVLSISERWAVVGAEYERVEYGYDLVDHPGHRRRAYHRHDEQHFLAAYEVAVHEHCEEVLGAPTCDHYAGEPVLDGYRGIDLLVRAWTDDALGCNELRCLD